MALLVLLNNFMHDFCAAGWIFGGVTVAMLMRKQTAGAPAGGTVTALVTLRYLMRLSLAGIVVFGIVRTLAYRSYEWVDAAGQQQVVLLVVKHILLTLVFLVGLRSYIMSGRLLKDAPHEP